MGWVIQMRSLTGKEIDELAAKKGVSKVAVENFLGSVGEAGSEAGELANMREDARTYKWNVATQKAIRAGIQLAYRG